MRYYLATQALTDCKPVAGRTLTQAARPGPLSLSPGWTVARMPAGEDSVAADFVPGDMVRHPQRPDWGLGQVQSVIGQRITVNFEHAGKVLILADGVRLLPVRE